MYLHSFTPALGGGELPNSLACRFSHGKVTPISLKWRLGEPHSPSGGFGEQKTTVFLAGNQTPDLPARHTFTIQTALSRL